MSRGTCLLRHNSKHVRAHINIRVTAISVSVVPEAARHQNRSILRSSGDRSRAAAGGTFLVERERFPAHRFILAARGQCFRALLYGGMKESQPQAEVHLEDTRVEAFGMLLQYLYTGRATLSAAREEVLLDFLGLANRDGLQLLEDSTSEFLRTVLSTQNVCLVFDVASLYSLSALAAACCSYMDRHAPDVLLSDGFITLTKFIVHIMAGDGNFLGYDDFCEKHNIICTKELYVSLLKAVPAGLVQLIKGALCYSPVIRRLANLIVSGINCAEQIPEENIATMKYGAQVVKGELKSALLDGDTQNYDLDHGFSRHPLEEEGRAGIQVKLGQAFIINHIRILLWDRDSRSYSYYIEVSVDELDWVRVVDHSKFLCRSWQNLYFSPRVCR
uniref:BTB domain containing 9 n=1 Tax=Sinocyclocheilus grahami TaxID=75366 RepID=A0A672Q637_SINGR